jgi:hypothetical protein
MWYSITLTVGLALLIASLFFFRKTIGFIKSSERTTATVIKLEEISSSDGRTWKPIFKYTTYTGKEYTYRASFSSSPSPWKVGDEAQLAYEPANPQKAKLLTYLGSFGLPITLLTIAMPLLVFGGGFFVTKMFLR